MSEYVNDEKKYVQKSPGLCLRSKENSRCSSCAWLGRNEKSCDVHKRQSDRATLFAVTPAVTMAPLRLGAPRGRARDGLRARAGDRRLVASEAADRLPASVADETGERRSAVDAQEADETGERRRAPEAGDDGRAAIPDHARPGRVGCKLHGPQRCFSTRGLLTKVSHRCSPVTQQTVQVFDS